MSIFTGIFSRHSDIQPPSNIIRALRASVSRSKDDADKLSEFSDDRLFMVKADIGAYGEPGVLSTEDQQGFVAGSPIIRSPQNDRFLTRSEELKIIAKDLSASRFDAMRACRGQYCAVVYDTRDNSLRLVVDKLAVRPIYYWISDDFVVFSTAMRIIEGLEFCKKSISINGVAEYAAFGYSLSDRTPYENVISLHAGEIVSFSGGEVNRRRYWRWDELPAPADDYPDVETRVYQTFREAVRVRLRNDKTTTAFLSGGLDSRSIAAMLRALNANVLTVSYGSAGSQDAVFAGLAAERLGTTHTEIERTPLAEGDAFSKATLLQWIKSPAYENAGVERPRLIWSGDGGSVGLGHVYVTENMVRLMRAGDITAAMESYLAHNRVGVHTRLLKPAIAVSMQEAIRRGVEEELNALHPEDRGRAIHLFLMLNDQRRHLSAHFENIDLGRVDFHEPFFDTDFLAAILREPIDRFLRHHFYIDWLKKFPPGVLEVTWQAYPGHIPCPISAPAGLSYQWSEKSAADRHWARSHAIAQAQAAVKNSLFSNSYVRKPYLYGFRLLLRAGLLDRHYWLHTLSVLHRYWSKANHANIDL
jgi:asparagine synthase (glutamine-hydrolysing)